MINEKTLNIFLNILSNEQLGKVIREFLKPSNILLTEIEAVFLNALNENKENYKQAALKRWQKVKEEKQEKTQKEDLPKKQYNNFKPFPSVTTNKQQNNKSTFTNDYLKTGVIKL